MKGERGKAPSIQWYYKDWLSDKKLQRATPGTRGIWMNLLMHMTDCSANNNDCKEGILEDVTIDELMQLGSCNEDAAWQFIEEALKHQFCDIELDKSKTFHIMSRRLSRDAEKREYWRKKKQLQRQQEKESNECPADVPPSRARPIPIPTAKTSTNKSRSAGIFEFINPELLKRVGTRWPKCYQWIQKSLNHKKNKNAILHVLNRIDQTKNINDFYGFVTEILKVENGNYNALEFDTQEAQRQKKELKKHLESIGEKI